MSNHWTEKELKAAVQAYIQMHSDEENGIPFVKKQIYAKLSKQFGRTEKSYEYRMQNISYVYSLIGRNWVSGLKPAKNVGSKVVEIIKKIIFEIEKDNTTPPTVSIEYQIISYKSKKTLSKPVGIKDPEKTYSTIANYIRDPKIKAWVLKEANGRCECCENDAPFITTESEPFLEVHHLRCLADGGSDTVSNTVSLCPNCHREMHYGINKTILLNSIYKKISRLIRE